MIISSSANFIGYLDLFTENDFNKKTPDPNSNYVQFDETAIMAAQLDAITDYYIEDDIMPPASHFIDIGNNLLEQDRYKDAEKAFEAGKSEDPDNIDAIIGLGMVKFYLGSFPFAASKFDDAIKLDGRNVRAWSYKAVSQANANNMNGALESIDKATTYGPSDPMAWYYAAAIYAENGDMNKASDAINKARTLAPDNEKISALYTEIFSSSSGVVKPSEPVVVIPAPTESVNQEQTKPTTVEPTKETSDVSTNSGNIDDLISSGQKFQDEEDYAEAEKVFSSALSLDDKNEKAWDGYLTAIRSQAKPELLKEKAQEAITKIPDWAGGYNNVAAALLELKQYDEALTWVEKAIEKDPTYKKALNVKGLIYYDQEQYTDALTAFEEAISADSEYNSAWYNKGRTLRLLENYDEAIVAFDKAISIDPEYKYSWYMKGLTLSDQEKYTEAIEAFDKAIAIDPNYKYAWAFKGNALDDIKKYQEAVDAFDEALRIDPKYDYALSKKGTTLILGLYNAEEALKAFEKAIDINPDDDYYWHGKAMSYFLLNRMDEALTAIEKAISLDTENDTNWHEKGLILKALGKYDDALKAFDKAISLGDTKLSPNQKAILLEEMKKSGSTSTNSVNTGNGKTQAPVSTSGGGTATRM